jgi:hypothetical protein
VWIQSLNLSTSQVVSLLGILLDVAMLNLLAANANKTVKTL